MSKKSRIKHQQKKKAAKQVTNMSRRQAQMSLELAAAREQLSRDIPIMDQLLNDTRQLARHVLVMESRLKNTVVHLETGAAITTPLMTRDEYILVIKEELQKILKFKSATMNPLMRKMGDTYEMTNTTDRLMGEAEMQVSLMEALGALRVLGEDVQENIGKLKLQESLDFKSTVPQAEADTATAVDTAQPSATLEPNADGEYTIPLMVIDTETQNGTHYPADTPSNACGDTDKDDSAATAALEAVEQDGNDTCETNVTEANGSI